MINHYENIPVSVPFNKIKIIADCLNVKVSAFFNDNGSSSDIEEIYIRWLKKIKRIKNLAESDRKEINRHINTILEKNNLKKSG